ncbi:MAG: nucleotidyltransferase family protein [Caldilineales bacterium]
MTVSAVVPAAGLSRRMGGDTSKVLLPWGAHTVVEQVVETLRSAGVQDILVVTGHQRERVEETMQQHAVRCVHNPDYASGEMLSSLQAGLQALPDTCRGALIALADQPQMEVSVVRAVVEQFRQRAGIVIPSYRMRRGHPILLPRRLWPEMLALAPDDTLRTMIDRHSDEIEYVVVRTSSILADLDTPEQYQREVRQ